MQRCLSIGRRATKPALVTAGVLLSTYELLKQSLMQSGRLEESLSKVTSSKIGIHEGTVNSRSELLKRLKRYRMLFGIVNTSRESQILARLEHAIEDMETDVSTGALRKQPFCVVLYGNPGVGKSSFSIQLAQKLMHGRYGRFTSHDMVTLNETDEYQSEFRTSHKVVLFDDIGAAKSDRPDTTNPWRKVIDFVNNVQKTALNPNCEMKGKVYIQPDLVILTTNLDLSKTFAMVGGFMNCPEAIARRCSSVIHLKDYLTGEIINYDGGSDHSTAFCGKMPTNLKSGLGTTVTRDYIVEELDKRFREHMIDQQKFVDKFNSYFDDLPTIDELYEEQSAIYEIQAEVAPKYDSLSEERRLNYLIANIDWDYYFCAYPEGHYLDVYYFDGYIYCASVSHPAQAIFIHKDYMNELRQKMLDITPNPYKEEEVMDIPDLVAEGNTISIFAESDTCIISDFQHDAFVGSQWDTLPCDEKEESLIIPITIDESFPYYEALLEFTGLVLNSFDSWSDLSLLLDAANGLGKKLRSLPERYEDPNYEMGVDLKRRVLMKIAYNHSSLFEVNPLSLVYFFFTYPQFGLPSTYAERALNRLNRVRDEWVIYGPDTLSSSESTSSSEKFSSSVAYLEEVSTDTPPESTTGDSHYRDLLREKVNSPIGMVFTTPPNSVNTQASVQDSDGYFSDTGMPRSISPVRYQEVDPSSDHYKSQTEDEQCDEFIRIINFPKKGIHQFRQIQIARFGEIDLVLEVEDFIFVVELKRSKDTKNKRKAEKQAKRYASVINLLRPDTRVFGITYTYGGIQVVCDNAKPFRSNVCDDLFKIIGYTKQPNV